MFRETHQAFAGAAVFRDAAGLKLDEQDYWPIPSQHEHAVAPSYFVTLTLDSSPGAGVPGPPVPGNQLSLVINAAQRQ